MRLKINGNDKFKPTIRREASCSINSFNWRTNNPLNYMHRVMQGAYTTAKLDLTHEISYKTVLIGWIRRTVPFLARQNVNRPIPCN